MKKFIPLIIIILVGFCLFFSLASYTGTINPYKFSTFSLRADVHRVEAELEELKQELADLQRLYYMDRVNMWELIVGE